jgi:acyl-CoA synthetase (AMP-forming)/AMP-acid ligase II/acyl carrier protein
VGSIITVPAITAARPPETIAVAAPGRHPLTFGALKAQIDSVRTALRSMGIGRGDCVAIAMPTGAERLVVQLAAMDSCAAAPLNPSLLPGEFSRQLTQLRAKAVIVMPGTEAGARVAAAMPGLACLRAHPVPGAAAGTVRLTVAPVAGAPGEARDTRQEDVVLMMQTSGTTADPKLVPLTLANIHAGAANVCATLALGPGDRLLSILQLHHIAGIGYSLAALIAGGSVFIAPGFDGETFFSSAGEADPTWFWAAPAMLHEMVRQADGKPGVLAAPRLRFIRVGSAPLPVELMLQAERLFGVPVLESYGMTEAAPQITSAPLPPAVRKPGSVGLPVGTEIGIVAEDGGFVPHGTKGEIVIRGASVMSGYRDARESDGTPFLRGWFRTGDLGYVDQDGYLFITGRLKEIINRGGEKISPLEIDRVLLSHPGVERAVTFPVPHPTLGEEIAAAVILRPGATADEQELQKFAISRLSVGKVPRYIYLVTGIPSDERGKVRRLDLAEQLGLARGGIVPAGGPEPEKETPRTPVEQELIVMWQDVLRLDEGRVGTEAHFLDLGGDSVSAAQIISRVRRTFNVDLSPLAFFEAPTIAGLAHIIEAKRGAGPVHVPG